ncbi:MAG: metal ABC transporter permease [Planctomycetota bacterium]|jgi:zinc/manganese transport system permease protein
MLTLLAPALVACVILTVIHCYLGIHVLQRGVIFVDLALAQIAALGAAVGILMGAEPTSFEVSIWALAFALAGAALFAFVRFEEKRVPQEALIGITYAVASSLTLLVLSRSAVDRDEIEVLLTGQLLFLDWPHVATAAAIYAGVAVVLAIFHRAIQRNSSTSHDHPPDWRRRGWDLLFYACFAVVVTSSVQMAGVLLVFCYLIVPAASAALFTNSFRATLLLGWTVGLFASLAGLAASYNLDLPTGPSIAACFGILFALASIAGATLAVRKIETKNE